MINPIILNKNSIERSSSIRSNYYSWLAPITCLLFQVGEWVSDFIPTVIFIAFPQVGEWVSDVILGDREGGMRLLYHPEGESTRFCFTFIFTAKYQNGKQLLCLVTFTGITSSFPYPFHLFGHFCRKNGTPMNGSR